MVQYHIPVHACSVSLHSRGIWQQAYSWDLLYTTGKILLVPYISARHKTRAERAASSRQHRDLRVFKNSFILRLIHDLNKLTQTESLILEGACNRLLLLKKHFAFPSIGILEFIISNFKNLSDEENEEQNLFFAQAVTHSKTWR